MTPSPQSELGSSPFGGRMKADLPFSAPDRVAGDSRKAISCVLLDLTVPRSAPGGRAGGGSGVD